VGLRCSADLPETRDGPQAYQQRGDSLGMLTSEPSVVLAYQYEAWELDDQT
jgi:hypothetical protein